MGSKIWSAHIVLGIQLSYSSLNNVTQFNTFDASAWSCIVCGHALASNVQHAIFVIFLYVQILISLKTTQPSCSWGTINASRSRLLYLWQEELRYIHPKPTHNQQPRLCTKIIFGGFECMAMIHNLGIKWCASFEYA